jgi:hypothetical protein
MSVGWKTASNSLRVVFCAMGRDWGKKMGLSNSFVMKPFLARAGKISRGSEEGGGGRGRTNLGEGE